VEPSAADRRSKKSLTGYVRALTKLSRDLGVSVRRLDGWEPTQQHLFEYEPVVWWKPWTWDRIKQVVVITEPEWNPEEVALLLASAEFEGGLNPLGTPLSEATDPANQFAYPPPSSPVVDWQMQALAKGQNAYYKNDDPKNPMIRAGHLWSAARKS
jgi:hypothetical protein